MQNINNFIKGMVSKFPVRFAFWHDKADDIYYIWYDADDSIIESEDFMELLGELMNIHFWSCDIYNVGVAYNPQKVKEHYYNQYKEKPACIKYNFTKFNLFTFSEIEQKTEYFIKHNISFEFEGNTVELPNTNYNFKLPRNAFVKEAPAA